MRSCPAPSRGPRRQRVLEGRYPDPIWNPFLMQFYSSSSTKDHRCILAQYDIPPFQLLLRDLVRFHDIARCKNRFILPASPGVAVQNFVESLKTMYVYTFLRANSYLPVSTAILQHYGLPTRALDVTRDPNAFFRSLVTGRRRWRATSATRGRQRAGMSMRSGYQQDRQRGR